VDFWDLTKLMYRRWMISLPLLLITITATVYVALTAKPDYVMISYVQLVPASSSGENAVNAALRNPWNQLGLGTLAQASTYATQDQKFTEELKANHHTANFTLTMTNQEPIVTFQTVGSTPLDATITTQLVLKRFQDSVLSLQKQYGVHDEDLIKTQRLDQGQNLQPSGGKVKRAIAAVGVAGLLLTCGVTVLFDAVARRRARRKAQAEKVDPLAVEIALAREKAAAAPTQAPSKGHDRDPVETALLPKVDAVLETALLPKVPAALIQPAAPPRTQPAAPAPAPPARPAEPAAAPAAPEPKAPPKPAGGEHSSGTRLSSSPTRPLQAGTYRSINAHTESAGDGTAEPPPPASSVPSDVRIVLQPEWMPGENGGKRR
jgi:hypothetical protein